MNRRAPGGPFPEGWEYFKPAHRCGVFIDEVPAHSDSRVQGRVFRALKLLPCKVPLDRRFDKRREELRQVREMVVDDQSVSTISSPRSQRQMERDRSSSCRYFDSWSMDELYATVARVAPSARLAAVINLCGTERYYEGNRYRDRGTEYVWCKTSGGGTLPRYSDIDRFFDIWCWLLERFGRVYEAVDREAALRNVPDDVPVVALHCTHGVNRTGYFFATLALLYRPGMRAEEAMRFFGAARGHEINREELRSALKDLYDDQGDPDVPDELKARVGRLRCVLAGVPLTVDGPSS